MADHNTPIPVLLKGGPCDGKRVTGERAPDFTLDYKCKGVDYQYNGHNLKDGTYIYVPYHAGGSGDGGGVAVPARAHKAWHSMLRTVFVDAPKQLKHSYNARAAIRRIRHRRGLR